MTLFFAVMCFVRSMHEQTKNNKQCDKGALYIGPNHKVKLGGNASNQIGTERCWAKSEISENRKGGEMG